MNLDCKTTCVFLTDGQITFITSDNRMIAGPLVNDASLQEDSDFEKDDKHASSQSILWWLRCSLLDSLIQTDKKSLRVEMDECTLQYTGLIWDSRNTKD